MENEHSFREGVEKYWSSLITDIPSLVFQILLSILCLGIIIFIAWKGVRKGFRYSIRFILSELVLVVLCSTVIFRKTVDPLKYNFHPFWSYFAINDGEAYLFVQNVMNVVIFIPIGFLLGCGFPKRSWLNTLMLGCILSITIETLQFIFKRGFCEFDDVMHNTLGCMIGYGAYSLIVWSVRKIRTFFKNN